jgi:hypothetical protein
MRCSSAARQEVPVAKRKRRPLRKDQLQAKIEAVKARIAKQRDILEMLIWDAKALEGGCADAIESLESAVVSLSEHV